MDVDGHAEVTASLASKADKPVGLPVGKALDPDTGTLSSMFKHNPSCREIDRCMHARSVFSISVKTCPS